MTTKPFRRYWAMTHDGLGLVIRQDHDLYPGVFIQINNATKWYYSSLIRPATFKEFCWRDDGFAGTNYTLFFAVWMLGSRDAALEHLRAALKEADPQTSALQALVARLMREEAVYAYQFEGRRYDCGSKLGYLQATVNYALGHEQLGKPFQSYLLELADELRQRKPKAAAAGGKAAARGKASASPDRKRRRAS